VGLGPDTSGAVSRPFFVEAGPALRSLLNELRKKLGASASSFSPIESDRLNL